MNQELPAITSSTFGAQTAAAMGAIGGVQLVQTTNQWDARASAAAREAAAEFMRAKIHNPGSPNAMANAKPKLRYVQIFIADPDENLSLADRLLFKSEPKMTDATNEELFFELDIKAMLDNHNQLRRDVTDRSIKDRTEKLQPVRVRDLQMVVVDIASF